MTGEYVEHPQLGRLEVLDDEDQSLLTVRTASGAITKIGKKAVGWGRQVEEAAVPAPQARAPAPHAPRNDKLVRRTQMENKIIEFKIERETKNTVRYEEETNGQPPAVGTLYVQKWALGSPAPSKLKVTIEGE